MTTLSDPTIGLLITGATGLLNHDYEEPDLISKFRGADLWRYRDDVISFADVSAMTSHILSRAQAHAEEGDGGAHRGLLKFAGLLAQEYIRYPLEPRWWLQELQDALLADGYQLTRVGEEGPRHYIRCTILPTDTGPIPLAAEVSALETDLAKRGYTTVLDHYRQAVDSFIHRNYGAANGQLRTALEALVVQVAIDHASYTSNGKANQGGLAIKHLVDNDHVPERDGGGMIHGVWQMTHTKGSHPGPSTVDEASIRMQLITAAVRFLLNRFPN